MQGSVYCEGIGNISFSSKELALNVSVMLTGFTEGAEEGANHGFDVDWDSCAYRRSDWWPVHVFQLVRFASGLRKPNLTDIHIPI